MKTILTPFLLVIIDRNSMRFQLEGPMTDDDRPWNDAWGCLRPPIALRRA